VLVISKLLTPSNFLKFIQDRNLSSLEISNLLFSLIEESDNENLRANFVDFFNILGLKSTSIFHFLENLLISDEFPLVRATAAKVIIQNYPSEALNPLKWAIQKDDSIKFLNFLKILISQVKNEYLESLNNDFSKRIEQIAVNYCVNTEEAIFLMEIGLNIQVNKELRSNSKIIYDDNIIYKVKDGHISALGISYWKSENLPNSIENLTKLKFLDLSYNYLKFLPESMINLSQLEYLDLSWNEFTEFPSFLASINNRDLYLDLKYNQIKSIPIWIKKLSFLKSLNLRNNKIERIPYSIGSLKNLEYLDLRENNIESIPSCIESLTSLKQLRLGKNRITKIPTAIQYLKALEVLDLEYNNIQNIPESISNLSSLVSFNIKNNEIKQVPSAIKSLKRIKFMN
jgi:Leucine-rich repeat (LRR) protein